jgi:hypothetical protein
MSFMAPRKSVVDRAQRLRALAADAEKVGDLAMVADQRIATVRHDLLTLANAARKLADKLTVEAAK